MINDKKGYIPEPTNKAVTNVMRANRGKNTKPELFLRKELWRKGLRGYRVHYKKIPGHPDIVFTRKKVVIFVNGCFWHRCPKCNLPLPKSHVKYWKLKFKKNSERDARKINELQNAGWTVIVVWECEVWDTLEGAIQRISSSLYYTQRHK